MKPVTRPVESFTYIPRADRDLPPDEQMVLTLRPMTLFERLSKMEGQDAYHTDPVTMMQVQRPREYTSSLETCLVHIVKVEHFPPEEPKPWPGPDAPYRERLEYLAMFSEPLIYEIGQEVFKRSTAPVTAGNSSSPTPTSG
jgi:hypothetical protein